MLAQWICEVQGKFTDGVYSGKGMLYYPDGQLHYEGVFYEGFFSEEGGLFTLDGKLLYRIFP